MGEIGTGVAAARRKISSSILVIFAAILEAKLFGVFGVRLSSIGLPGPAEMLDSDEMARAATTSDDLAVAPLFSVDAIELQLVCLGVSGISTPLPFWIED